MIKLMYITNDIKISQIAQNSGVDRIFIDLETLGKHERQGHIDSVKSNHTVNDVAKLRPYIDKSELLVRVNPMHSNSKNEIDSVINNGADIVMLPMYKTVEEVKTFIDMVNKRTRTMLLLETKEAHEILEDVLKLPGIDEIHIGLNDLHLCYQKKFMFELLIDGTVSDICAKISKTNIRYGFGGVAAVGEGTLPAEEILCEHYKLGSQIVILSRSFCNTEKESDLSAIETKFKRGVMAIRKFEQLLQKYSQANYEENYKSLTKHVKNLVNGMK